MNESRSQEQLRKIREAFAMPSVQTMVSRKSSITNAFVNSLIPVVDPSLEEIEEALRILGMSAEDVRCAYCGDPSTEWDHLRPLVIKRRPTGYISEIGNLVPACGKCNQSKGNKHWLAWMTSGAPRSPSSRRTAGTPLRIERLKAYEIWRPSPAIEFEQIVGPAQYHAHWERLDEVIEALRQAQVHAEHLRQAVAAAHNSADSRKKIEAMQETAIQRPDPKKGV